MPTEESYFSDDRTGNQQFEADKADYKKGTWIRSLADGVKSGVKSGRSRRSSRRANRRSSRSASASTLSTSKNLFAAFGPKYAVDRSGKNRPMVPFISIAAISRNINTLKWPAKKSTKFSNLIRSENKVMKPIIGLARPGTQIKTAIAQDEKKKSNTTLIAAAILTPIALLGGFFGYRHVFSEKSDDGSQNYIY